MTGIIDDLSADVCDDPTLINTGAPPVDSHIDYDELMLFKVTCAVMSRQLQVRVWSKSGNAHVFVSHTDVPGPFNAAGRDTSTTANKTVLVDNSNGPVYIGVLGATLGRTEFALQVDNILFQGGAVLNVTVPEGPFVNPVVVPPPLMQTAFSTSYVPRYSFTLLGDSAFYVATSTGALGLARQLDYEQQTHYDLQLQARDSTYTCLSSTLTVHVNVADINDNPPVFVDPQNRQLSISQLSLLVSEAQALGSSVATVLAVDRDAGLNGMITYTIANADPPAFDIGPTSGVLSLARLPLDYETATSARITVRATDGGGLWADLAIFITVLDAQDDPPIFNPRSYTALIAR